MGSRDAAVAGKARAHEGPGPQVLACSTLAGGRVVNRSHEELGTLEHLTIDLRTGHIAYGVLSRGGVLGLGARLFAVPWDALELDQAGDRFVLDVPLACVRDAAGFDRDHWPSHADARFERAPQEKQPQRSPDETHSLP